MNQTIASVNAFFFGQLLFIGALLHFLPNLTRPDIYFAITVPPDFRASDAGRRILRQSRTHLWLHTLVGAALLVFGLLFGLFALMLAGIYWQVFGAFLAFQTARRKVSPHAVAPATEREAQLSPRRSGIPGSGLLHLGPFALLAAAAVYLRAHWDEIPARFPVHWGLNGEPNHWATRTAGGVYAPLLMGAMMCAMIVFLWFLMLYGTRQVRASGAAAVNEGRFRRVQLICLLSAEYLLAFVFAWVSQLPLRTSPGVSPPGLAVLLIVMLVYVGGIVAVLIHTGQGGSRLRTPANITQSAATGAPVGDRTPDQCWKLGVFYVNRDDPAILVEKRFGIGYTLNMGHPLTWVVFAVLLLPAAAIAIFRHAVR